MQAYINKKKRIMKYDQTHLGKKMIKCTTFIQALFLSMNYFLFYMYLFLKLN